MSELAKPDIENLKSEGKISLIEFNTAGYYDEKETLFDGDLHSHTCYGVILAYQVNNCIIFKNHQKCNLWAYGENYRDSGGCTPKSINLYKKIGNDFMIYKENIETRQDEWYILFKDLEKGIYKIKHNDNYVMFTEWYCEKLVNTKYIIKQNESYFSIKPKSYKDSKFSKLPELDFIKYGFDDLNDLFNPVTINEDTFRPIEKFLNNKYDILIKDCE